MDVPRTHYGALKKFLAAHLAREQAGGAGSRTNAREKLTRLTKQQFQELSTDVYDELTRRVSDINEVPFLPVRDEFHPKRNQARQKLATLAKSRFKDLASDVFYELDRRYPEFKDIDFSSQSQQNEPSESNLGEGVTFQAPKSNTIVPEKGILKEEIMDYTIQKPSSRPDTPSSSDVNNTNKNANGANYPPLPNGMPPEYATPRSPRSRSQSQGSSVSDFGRRYQIQSVSSEGSNKDRIRDTIGSQKTPNKNEGLNIASLDSLMEDIGQMFDHKQMQNGDTFASGNLPLQTSSFPESSQKESAESLKFVNGIDSDKLQTEIEKVKSEYETRLASFQTRINELETALLEKGNNAVDNVRIQDLEQQLEKQKQINQQQTAQLVKLENDFNKLNEDHQQQQEDTNDVRKEATNLLEEIQSLSKRNDDLSLEKEQDAAQIKALKAEVAEWKTRYEKKKTELRNLKATSSFIKEPPKIDVIKDNLLAPAQDGGINETRIISYQAAIDELLRAGRSDVPTDVFMAMKSIVIACKSITEDVDSYEQRKASAWKTEDRDKLDALKTKLTATLTNLMTAAKNHAAGGGISPVSLLDAAASHLTAALVDLVKLVKLKRTNEQTENGSNNLADPFPTSLTGSRSPTPNSQYIPSQGSKGDHKSNDAEHNQNPVDIEEIKQFLERQAETIVSEIQSLLSAIRNNAENHEIKENVNTIITIVTNVIAVCRDAFSSASGTSYKSQGEPILKSLESNVKTLDEMRDSIPANNEEFNKKQLASASFQLAKFTKELVSLIG